MSSKELKCIKQAYAVKLSEAKARLVEHAKSEVYFENLVGVPYKKILPELISVFGEKESVSEKIKYGALLPVTFFLVISLILMTPFAYAEKYWEHYKEKQKIKKEIKEQETKSLSVKFPEEKVLVLLWQLHGLNRYDYKFDVRLNLLSIWIEILYGRETLNTCDLPSRRKEISSRYVKLNQPYYAGTKGAAHFEVVGY